MRSRNLKPSIFTNEFLAVADPLYTLIFEGLWCLADREGRLEDRPAKIHMAINPGRSFDGTDGALKWLESNGFIARYESGNIRCIQIINFTKHQNPHQKEAPSKLPEHQTSPVLAPDTSDKSTSAARLIPDSGFLIPDSPSPITATPAWPGVCDALDLDAIKARYPAGTYRAADWLIAERNARRLLDARQTSADALCTAVADYAAQQQAMGKTATQYVLAPSKFFSDGNWRGPFPLPATKAQNEQDARIDVSRKWLEKTNAIG